MITGSPTSRPPFFDLPPPQQRQSSIFFCPSKSSPLTSSTTSSIAFSLKPSRRTARRRHSPIMSPSINQTDALELTEESDFDGIVSPSGLISICGFGSLLSERSSRSTFPDLLNFRVARLNGFRRVFAHAAPIFFERGIAKPETKISSLSFEQCEGEALVVTVFEIKKSEIPAFIERELEFQFLAVVPGTLDGQPFDNPAHIRIYTPASLVRVARRFSFSIMANITSTRSGEMIFYLVVLIFDTAKNLGNEAYENFLDHDRKTIMRQYLSTTGAGIMEEEPPESLKTRYGG